MATSKLSVWIVEDNDLYRESIVRVLEAESDMGCPVATASCEEALEALAAGDPPEIVLMDIGLPGADGIEGTRRFRELSPESRIIMLTVHEEQESVFDAVCAGASGYLLKSDPADGIVAAVREVSRGAAPMNSYIASKVLAKLTALMAPPEDYDLTAREREVLHLLVDGLAMKQVAGRLDISYHTVDTHVRNVYGKLHVQSRAEAVAKALRQRLL